MNDKQKIQYLVGEFFSGLVAGLPNKDRLSDWRAYTEEGKYFAEYQQKMCYGSTLSVIAGNLFGNENHFYLNGDEYINLNYGLIAIKVKFCLNDLKFEKQNNNVLFLYLHGSAFNIIELDPIPISWAGHDPLSGILPDSRGCFAYVHDKEKNMDWALSVLKEIQITINSNNVNDTQDAILSDIDCNIDKAIDELKDLLKNSNY